MSFPPGGIQAALQEYFQDHGLCWLLQVSAVGEVAGEVCQQYLGAPGAGTGVDVALGYPSAPGYSSGLLDSLPVQEAADPSLLGLEETGITQERGRGCRAWVK